jgi:translation elongation factor EF-G
MHFLGTIAPNEGESDAAAAVRLFPDAKKGDVVISTKTSKEYVYVSDTTGTEADWREFGDESSYATKTALTDEKNAREAADNSLNTAIEEVKTDLSEKYNELTGVDTAISAAVDAFKTTVVDTYATKESLTTAETNLKAVDTALSAAIDTLDDKTLKGVSLNGNTFAVTDGVASFTFDTIECGGAE